MSLAVPPIMTHQPALGSRATTMATTMETNNGHY
jgi:hypothetical protein